LVAADGDQSKVIMLTELHIQNFAIIDKLDLRFGPGLIILTGETGAGKSIIFDAVVMLIGGKADTTLIRTDSDAAFVEGVFQLKGPEREAVHEILNREELMDDPDYVVLMREIRREGRSVARVNGRTVNVGLLKELGAVVVDIHGQAEHFRFSIHAPIWVCLTVMQRWRAPQRLPSNVSHVVEPASRVERTAKSAG
jgi:DNA repair ATPase RecN